jgi:hypothetical protein
VVWAIDVAFIAAEIVDGASPVGGRDGNGPIPVIATDRAARADAFLRVLEFLKLRLETN